MNKLAHRKVDVVIAGMGTAGIRAMREVRQAGQSFAIVDHGPLGTTCARIGCMPSKLALHAGHLWKTAHEGEAWGISGTEHLHIDTSKTWTELRRWRSQFAGGAEKRSREVAAENLLEGTARLISVSRDNVEIEVQTKSSEHPPMRIEARALVIATGSKPVMPKWLESLRPQVITTDELFELQHLPNRLGILGLGAIGLEMGLALSRLGVRVTAADVSTAVGGIADIQIAKAASERFSQEMDLWLGTKTLVSRQGSSLLMQTDSRTAEVDLLLVAMGRQPNISALGLKDVGIHLNERGLPPYNPLTTQIDDLPIFIAGDANGERALLHEAADEGGMAGFNAAHINRTPAKAFVRKTPLAIAFTDPDIATVGLRYNELPQGRYVVGSAQMQANGRARILGSDDGLLHIYADSSNGRLLGAAIFGARAEHLAHWLAFAIARGECAEDLLNLPFYHPAIEELLPDALKAVVAQLHG